MSYAEGMALLPLIILAVSAVLTMLTISVYRDHRLTATLSVAGLALAICSLPAVASFLPQRVTALLIMDSYAFFFMGLIFSATIAVALFSYGYLQKRNVVREEFYLLLLLASLGAAVLVASSHFVSFFLGLETLSVSLYALLAYLRTNERGLEAAIKYLILAAVSSAFLLFGMALLYAQFGTMELGKLAGQATRADAGSLMLLTGTVMVISGIGFKLALVPFHMWTPDVYEGAPAPVTAFVATVSKGAVFGLLLRYFGGPDIPLNSSLFLVFSVIAVASMFIGNLLALLQTNIKRILAYSSIAHIGYLLVAFLAGGPFMVTSVTFYFVAYFVTTLAAFGVIISFSGEDSEADTLDHYRSLAWSRPWTTCIFTVALLSLAGIPLTAGFLGKFYLLSAGVHSSLWFLVVMLVVNSAIGLFYYLRIIRVMFHGPEKDTGDCLCTPSSLSSAGSIMLTVLFFLLLWLGIYPGPMIEIIRQVVIIR
jgi:NADH-quinone oxidoreductase subunit N